MPGKSIKQKRKIKTDRVQNLSTARRPKRKPDILQKLEAQVSQETFLEEEFDYKTDISDLLDEFPAEDPTNAETQEIIEELSDYTPEEVDADNDSDLAPERESIFDFYEGNPSKKISPDIIMEEIVPYPEVEGPAIIDVFIPLKQRLFYRKRKRNKEYEIRAEALEGIAQLIADKDKAFLLTNVFDPALITQKRQKDIARLIGKDETWITRLKQSCIVQTPRWGMQPLSLFLPEEKPSGVIDYSDQIVTLINNEDPFKPLSIEDLTGLISNTETDYNALTSNAGSKLRRILESLSIPPPKERLRLAKVFMDAIDKHKDSSSSDIIDTIKTSCGNAFSESIVKYRDFSDKIIQRLKDRSSSQ